MSTYNQDLSLFINTLEQYDWFCDVELDDLGRFVVYVDRMDLNFIRSTPDKIGGHHVLFHYISSQPMLKEKQPNHIVNVENYPTEELETNLDSLIFELDRLEKICGSNILQDIFYEVHDGKNAVTNLSNKFPEVRQVLDSLYNEYGFDLIYEELD